MLSKTFSITFCCINLTQNNEHPREYFPNNRKLEGYITHKKIKDNSFLVNDLHQGHLSEEDNFTVRKH